MVSPFVLAALQLSAPEIDEMAREFLGPERYSNRLDCVTRHVLEGATRSQSNTVYVFPGRPHLRAPEDLREVNYVRTMNDGRSWIGTMRVAEATFQRWPRFSARIADGDGEVHFASDPAARGRVTLRASNRVSHGSPMLEEGDCRFIPEIPTNEAPAR